MEFGLVALWIGVFLLLGVLALPLATWLLDGLDSAAFAVPVALATVGVVAHLVGQVAFGWPALVAGLTVLLGGSALAARRTSVDYRSLLEPAGVFVAAFLLVVLIRGFDPAAAPLPLAIGEKMLDFGLLASLDRAGTLPPEDVWFAGEPVRYYYGGHMLTALVGTLTGTAPRFAYNLGLAGFYATLVTAAYGLAGSIARPYGISRRVAAALGAFFVGIASNLETPAKLLGWLLPEGALAWVVDNTALDAALLDWTPADFFYFDASRTIPIDPTAEEAYSAATEFPLFSWLNGDLHAHMLSQPFMLLVGALLLAFWRGEGRRRALLLFGAVPPVVGLIALVNGWSFPTAGGLVVLAVLFAPGDPAAMLPGGLADRLGPRETWYAEELRRVGLALAAGVAVLILGVVWTLPFWTVVLLGGPGKSVAPWGPWSPLGGLLLVLGGFLAVGGAYLARGIGTERGRAWAAWAGGIAVLAAATLLGAPALGIAVALIAGGWWLLRTRSDTGFELVLIVGAAGLVGLVDLVTVQGERFNVIFKAYAHVWLFFAVAAGVALARLADGWPTNSFEEINSGGGSHEGIRRRLRWSGRALAAVLVVTTSVWGAFALPSHVGDASPEVEAGGPTLDARAYVDVEYPREAAAIEWIDARAGQPTIVTAAPGGYDWQPDEGEGSSAPASLTGVPSVLGWFHERQYRGADPYEERLADVRAIYASDDRSKQRALLEKYGVEYVYVGPAERATYERITVGNLPGVSVAEEFESVTIYAVG
jgi:YYY domain-containing protein